MRLEHLLSGELEREQKAESVKFKAKSKLCKNNLGFGLLSILFIQNVFGWSTSAHEQLESGKEEGGIGRGQDLPTAYCLLPTG